LNLSVRAPITIGHAAQAEFAIIKQLAELMGGQISLESEIRKEACSPSPCPLQMPWRIVKTTLYSMKMIPNWDHLSNPFAAGGI
jgi:hypothetical protein